MTPEQSLLDGLRSLGAKTPTAPTQGSPEEDVLRAKGDPDPTKPITLRNLFTHPAAHPVVLHYALLKSFGQDWFTWEPETIWEEVQETFKTQISELCRQKILALQACQTSMPWAKWQVFEKVAQALNGNYPDVATMQLLSLEEIFAAVDMLDTLRKDMPFSEEVQLYLAAIFLEENVFLCPAPMGFLQLHVSQPHYRCNDCGNEESALVHDGLCSNCTDRMNPLQGLSLQPMPEKVQAGKGRNLSLVLRYDPTAVAERWNVLKAIPYVEFSPKMDDMADVQCGQLLLARDYMNVWRKRLAEQLTGMRSWLESA